MRSHTIQTPDGCEVTITDLPGTFPLVLPICRETGLDKTIDELCPMKTGEHLSHGQIAEFVVLHLLHSTKRLPLYKLDEWAAEHNIHELYGFEADAFNDYRVGRTLDAISAHAADIQSAVATQAMVVYKLNPRVFHWDFTSVTFSDARQRSGLVQSGHGGGDLNERQVQLSVLITSDGAVPVIHQTLPGNASQPPLVPQMLDAVQKFAQRSDVVVVSDRKGISYDGIGTYREVHGHFLGPLTYHSGSAVATELAALPPEKLTPLTYRSMNAPEEFDSYYQTTLQVQPPGKSEAIPVQALFIDSARRRETAQALRQRQVDRCLQRLEKITGHLNQRRYAKRTYALEQLTKAVPPELAAIVPWELTGEDRSLRLSYHLDEAALRAVSVAAGDGRYILVYDLPDEPSPHQIYELYRRQAAIEARFRTLNTDLEVHPQWLHKDERILALLLLFMLALMVFSLLELLSERAGLDTQWYHKMTARELIYRFSGIRMTRTRLRGKTIELQLVIPEEQQYILDQMGLPNPRRYLM
jgi:transposase